MKKGRSVDAGAPMARGVGRDGCRAGVCFVSASPQLCATPCANPSALGRRLCRAMVRCRDNDGDGLTFFLPCHAAG